MNDKDIYWLCRCDCGKEGVVNGWVLRKGMSKSCGCYRKEVCGDIARTHGLSGVKLHRVWFGMKERCRRRENLKFHNYGGRGITVCDEWQNFKNFYEWALNNGYKEGLQIDRIDNNGNYSPKNCRFITSKENNRNRGNNRIIEAGTVKKCVAEWEEYLEMPARSLYHKLGKDRNKEDEIMLFYIGNFVNKKYKEKE